MTSFWALAVARDDLSRTTLFEDAVHEIGDGEALLRVDRVGLTANNVTYAVLGESFRYWDFFPTQPGWGLVPLWGFADIVASAVGGVPVGGRIYGYLPSASHLVVRPGRAFFPGLFDLRGVAFAAWTLAAFAIGALAGMLIRRVVPAIAATLAVYAGLAFAAGGFLRQHYLTPLLTSNPNVPGSAWIFSQWWTDQGRHLATRGSTRQQPSS